METFLEGKRVQTSQTSTLINALRAWATLDYLPLPIVEVIKSSDIIFHFPIENQTIPVYSDVLLHSMTTVNIRHKTFCSLAATYPISFEVPNWWPKSLLKKTSYFLSSKDAFLDALLFPRWTDQFLTAILLLHPKFIQTTELLQFLIKESESFLYFYRILYIWFREDLVTMLRQPRCWMLTQGLLQNLNSRISSGTTLPFILDLHKIIVKV
jgi:hypothetical protein